jgi:phosphoglycerol transferase MdoB-like AlkP superfamily enzyme
VVISLETAPGPYYPILNNPDLPNFTRMSQAGISTKRHYSNTPFTTWAVYTMLSGTYPAPGGRLAKYGPFRTDGLANVLQGQGYQTTFIDSYKIDWVIGMQTHQFTWRHLGFDNLVDNADSEYVKSATSNYDRKVKSEEKSFANALTAITRAESEKKHAVVFLATLLGHYKWPAPPGQECEPAETKLERIASVYDRLIGEFMDNLERAALLDDTIIVVTGDHGLRYQNEFESLAADSRDHEAAFNVPFALYAPGIFDSGIELPYVTSHVDITPTLLDLLGVDIAGMYHHGNSMLDPTTADRVTFMMNTQLSPTDWLHWDGNVLSYNNLTDQLRFIRKSESADEFERLMMDRYGSARHLFNAANSHFATSAARSLKLGASEGWDASRAALSSSEEPSP